MAITVQGAVVTLGVPLRCADGWEGVVIALDELNDWVTLRMDSSGEIRSEHPADLHWNSWAPQIGGSG